MATTNSQETSGLLDQSIPQWKRELILRRRALGRTICVGNSSVKLTCPSIVASVRHPEACENVDKQQRCSAAANKSSPNQSQLDFHPGSSSAVPVGNMRLVDQFSDVISSDKILNYSLTTSGITTSAFKCLSSKMGEEKSVNLKTKTNSSCRSVIEKVNAQSVKQNSLNENYSRQATNGNDEDYISDSSEELQYGPGIVSKLKTKYLSMTLKESEKRNVRPSLSNLRRATSLENMLDDDSCSNKLITHARLSAKSHSMQFTKVTANIPQSKYLRTNRNDSMKRASSMDTLLKTDIKIPVDILKSGRPRPTINDITSGKGNIVASIINEDLIIVEQSTIERENSNDHVASEECKHSISRSDKELPRPDVVKQTLKFFEISPTRKNKSVLNQTNTNCQPAVQNTNRLNTNIEKQKVATKPQISPKPLGLLSPEKLRQNRSPKTSRKVQKSNAIVMSPTHSKQEKSLNQVVGLLTIDTNNSEKQVIHSPRVVSPQRISPIVTIVSNTDQYHSPVSSLSPKQNSVNRPDMFQFHSRSADNKEDDFSDEEVSRISKPVSQTALENIRKGGLSMHFNFGSDQTSKNKSYLPGIRIHPQATNAALVTPSNHIPSEKTLVVTTVTPLKSPDSHATQAKQIGIIRPIITNKLQNTNSQTNSSTSALTEQEIEKNLINRVKSIEQPVSKVVVAIKSLPDSMVVSSVSPELSDRSLSLPHVSTTSETRNQNLWDKKPWHQNQNTVVFNFSSRKDVPDYIENDGLILCGKRDRPRPGEGGIILLDSGIQESCTDADCDDWTLDPPSPCNVVFEGDNILINGKSNLSKIPKQRKLRIQFNDAATTMFEYPSETSLVEEDTTAIIEATAPAPGVAISLGGPKRCASTSPYDKHALNIDRWPLGGNLGSYTPRQLGQGVGETWQLGVTRSVSTCVSANSIVTTSVVSETHIKPAPPECTVAWSEETATDLLF